MIITLYHCRAESPYVTIRRVSGVNYRYQSLRMIHNQVRRRVPHSSLNTASTRTSRLVGRGVTYGYTWLGLALIKTHHISTSSDRLHHVKRRRLTRTGGWVTCAITELIHPVWTVWSRPWEMARVEQWNRFSGRRRWRLWIVYKHHVHAWQ